MGRKNGPLAPFIKGRRNDSDTGLLQQCGEVTTESGRPLSPTNSGRKKHRGTGQRYCSQRGDRRPKHSKTVSPNDSRRKQATKPKCTPSSRPDHDCHDTTSDSIVSTRLRAYPTLVCVRCGSDVAYTNENRCEDCLADDQQLWHGRDLSVDLNRRTNREIQ